MVCPWRYDEHPRSFYMGVPQGISFIFFYQIRVLLQFQLPLAMLWKRDPTRIWGVKFDRKTLTIICEVKLNDNSWHYLSTKRYRMPFLKGIAKEANLTPCQTNQLYIGPRGGGYSIYPWMGRCGVAPDTLTHTHTVTNITDFPTLFKTEFRFLIPCLRHLTQNQVNIN